MWWCHFVEQHVPLMHKVVRVHMDEPSICMWQGGMRQLVKVERRVNRFLFLDQEDVCFLADMKQKC